MNRSAGPMTPADKAPPEVVTVGNMVADVIVHPLRPFPAVGQIEYVDSISLQPGGNGVNTAVALRKLGVRVAAVGRVGDDRFGDFLVHAMEEVGVDVQAVARDERATAVTLAGVREDADRSFLHAVGANAALRPEDIPWERFEGAHIFHLASVFVLPSMDGPPGVEVLKKASALGMTTVLDICWDASGRWMEAIAPYLRYVDYFLPNLDEARGLTGLWEPDQIAERLIDAGCGCVVIKLGREGCLVRNGERSFRVPGFAVAALDSTGAGDAFGAGFMAALVRGWPLQRAAHFANAVGARAVSARWMDGLLSFEETVAWMET